jgi:glycosyltransferase involved in cell wall biosynthesis
MTGCFSNLPKMAEKPLNILKLDVFKETNHLAVIGQKGIPAGFKGTSGVEFYVEYRVKRLVAGGKKVDCYVRNWATPKAQTDYLGINLIHIPTINTKHLDATIHSFLASIHVCFSPADTVWYQASGPALFSFVPKLFGKKIIVTIHTLEWQRDKWGFIAQLVLKLGERVGVTNADAVITVSADLSKYLKVKYGCDAFIDPPVVESVKKLKPDIITRKYGLKGNDYILYLGRFVPEKRIEWLIEAYQKFNPKGIKLVLAGGSSHTDKYAKKLLSLSSDNPNIIYTGYVLGREKQELLSNCKLLVIPSAIEGSPVVLKELPEKIPVIVSENLVNVVQGRPAHFFGNNNKGQFLSIFNDVCNSVRLNKQD